MIGGAPLFDQGAQVRELGFDVDAMFTQAIEGLKASDWASFREAFPAPLSEETKQFLAAANDPVSAGYVSEASSEAFPPFTIPPVRSMAFWGSGEAFNDRNAEVATEHGIEMHVVEGEHDGAFTGVAAAMDGIVPFLKSR